MTWPLRLSLVIVPASPASMTGGPALLAEVAAACGDAAEVLVLAPGGAPAVPAPARAVAVTGRGRGAWLSAGATAARGEVVVFLHADAVPRPGFLPPLLDALGRPGVGLAASRLVDPDGRTVTDGLILTYGRPWPLGVAHGGDSTTSCGTRAPLEVQAASDVTLAVRADTLASLGGFDAAFTAGGAAVDLCLRAGQVGLGTLVARRSVVTHPTTCQALQGDEPLLSRRWYGRVPVFDADRLRDGPRHPPRPGRPPVSVVVPAEGAAARLPRFLETLLACLGPADELIVAVAGSGDGTTEFVEALGRDAPIPVRLASAAPGTGLVGAAVSGLAAVTRPMVAVLHPAATTPPELLDEVTRFLESQAQYDVVAFPVHPVGMVACGRREVLRGVALARPEALFTTDPTSLEAAAREAGGRAHLLAGS